MHLFHDSGHLLRERLKLIIDANIFIADFGWIFEIATSHDAVDTLKVGKN